MALGSRWLPYSPIHPLPLNTGRVSPKSLASSVSPSTSLGNGTAMARYAIESSKQLATGILTLGDMGYKKLSKLYPDLLPDGASSPDWKIGKLAASESENAGFVIQDICSSHDSRWIAIVSLKGTCHVFVLSPFRGDETFKALRANGQRTSLFLSSAPPWWCTPSFNINDKFFLPPPPCTLSVVSWIKCSDSGLLISVSNAAASVMGKIWVPSGAVAAIFHNSNSTGSLDTL